jgi:DNA-binding transcriptional MerR regulator
MDPKDRADRRQDEPQAMAAVVEAREVFPGLDRAIDSLRELDTAQGELFAPTHREIIESGSSLEPWSPSLAEPAVLPTPEWMGSSPPADADVPFEAEDAQIPEGQSYFKIGEVARIVGVKPYVLRYWEREFPWIRPEKTSSKQRRYRRQDVVLLLLIRKLRHDEQLTIAKTREIIQDMRKSGKRKVPRARAPLPRGDDNTYSLGLPQAPRVDTAQLHRRLVEIRQAVLDLLHAVED